MEAFPCEFYTVNYLLVIELIRQFLHFGTFKIWYLKSAYVLNWMDSTCKPAPWWANPACLMQEFKNKTNLPLSISRTTWWNSALCCRHLVKPKSVRARVEMGWSASVCAQELDEFETWPSLNGIVVRKPGTITSDHKMLERFTSQDNWTISLC